MSTPPPSIEVLPGPHGMADYPPMPPRPERKNRRLAPFLLFFALCLGAGQAYVWSRTPLYQSAASLLTVAPEEATGQQPPPPPPGPAPSVNLGERPRPAGGVEHVSLQRQILLGVPVFEETLRRLYQQPELKDSPRLGLDDLRKLLSVGMVAETNLVELKAQGPKPAILAPLVNAWIDAYQALREQTTQTAAVVNYAALEQEARQLDRKVEAKREALERFRALHGIQAKTDSDNTPILRLKGLNEALSKAVDEQAKAKSKLDAVRAAVARGEPALPPAEAPGLEHLEKRAQELREMQKDLQRRYTPAYLAMHPQLKQIPGQLAQVEAEILQKAENGSRALLSQAAQDQASAQQTVAELRQQIEDMKRDSSDFGNRFAEQETMKADLDRLEGMRREAQAKLAQAESRPKEPYPPLQVVERAYPPAQPVWPLYWRDSGIALGASLLLALAFIWLYDYLTRAEAAPPAPAAMPNFQFYSVQGGQPPRLAEEEAAPALPARPVGPLALESPFPRELTEHEIRVLLEAADGGTRRWIALLLSGLSVAEAAGLGAEHLDLTANRILVLGERPRTLPLAPRLKACLAQSAGPSAGGADEEEVEARIRCAAFDSGLAGPDSLDAAALRHSYIAHLVRLGIRLSELEGVVGRLPARLLASYGRLSPPGPGLPAGRVPLMHPALMDGGAGE